MGIDVTIVATAKTAFLTGVISAFVLFLTGPSMEGAKGFLGDLFLVLGALVVGLPAYFFVFGVKRSERVSLWAFKPELLKRIGAWFLGAASIGALAQFYMFFT